MLGIAVSALATSTFIIEMVHRICVSPITVLFEALPRLPATGRGAFAHVDHMLVDGVERAPAVSVRTTMRQNESLELRGWAVDPVRHAAAADVFLVVDGGPSFRATYGNGGDFALNQSGRPLAQPRFYGVVPTGSIALGAHLVHVRIVAADLSGYYEVRDSIAIYVR